MSSEEISVYSEHGYIVRKGLLSSKEVALIRARARASIGSEIREGKTGTVKTLTNEEEDQYGFLGRDERLVDLAQNTIGKPIYRYRHSILPNVGADDWHQDFAWWYADGFLAPQFATVYVPFDTATRENSCLRVLKGSHKLGRLKSTDDHCVDQEQLEAALKRFEVVYVEMDAGDVMIFDGNLVHGSDTNRTDTRLWTYHCYYNAVENVPYKAHGIWAGHDEPLEKPARVWMSPDAARFSAQAQSRAG